MRELIIYIITLRIAFSLIGASAAAAWEAGPPSSLSADFSGMDAKALETLRQDEDKLNLFCLRLSYPGIKGIEERSGQKWLVTDDGSQILYSAIGSLPREVLSGDDATVAESMELPYVLEPERPDLPQGFSPGRRRSKPLLDWLYGNSRDSVSKGLGTVKFRGKNMSLHREPLRALEKVIPELNRLAEQNPDLKIYLEPSGGFNWRKIAGENRLSPHSYGIALDIGVNVSPYWRWARINPHPKQKTYPSSIVRAFEDNGFIWGGKWHEYDLMHFEYRPELICKARIKAMF